jgi:copper chaperone
VTTRVFEVPAISCGHCKQAIEGAVGALDDVDTVTVDIDARTVAVDGDADDDTIVAAIDEAGYDVAGRTAT